MTRGMQYSPCTLAGAHGLSVETEHADGPRATSLNVMETPHMLKLIPGDAPAPRRLVGVSIRRGAQRITRLVQPALTVVREAGKPPRVVLASNDSPRPAA